MSLENYMPDFALEKAYDVTVDSLKKHSGKILKCYTFVSLKKSFRICRLSGFEAMPLNGSR